MVIATHLIKVKGIANRKKWPKKKLKKYIKQKFKGIELSFHAKLELLKTKNKNIELLVYISAYPSEVSDKIVDKWIKTNLKEKGILVKKFEIKLLVDTTKKYNTDSPQQIMIRLP